MAQNILRDVPVTKIKNERLGLGTYATALSEFIRSCDTPVTIGIQGDWGIGKSSLLNMITENLSGTVKDPKTGKTKRNNPYTLKIETWQYALFTQEEHIAFSVINAINQGLIKILKEEKKEIKEEKKAFFSKFAKFGLSMADQLIANKTGASIKQASKDSDDEAKYEFEDIADAIKQYKEQFISLLEILIPEGSKKKLVIMLDDLDRIKPIRALELLEAIKNFLDIPKCVFILAVDYSVIEQGMEEKLGKSAKDFYGKSFFDKIIQIPFNMPIASYKTDHFVMSMLGFDYNTKTEKYERNDIVKEGAFLADINRATLDQNIADYFANITEVATKKNPRSIKRLVNYSNLLKLICRGNRSTSWNLLDAQIVYTLAALQLSWPEIFNYFAANPAPGVFQQLEDTNYISDIQEAKPLFDRQRDPVEVQNRISGLFDEFLMLIDGQKGEGQGDGEISTEEFKPVWQVMIDTNLTNAKLEDIDEQWKSFRKPILDKLTNTKSNNWIKQDKEEVRTLQNKKVKMILQAFEKGNWNNQLFFRLLGKNKSFRNIIWGKKQVGSIVTTQGDILTLYINEKSLFGSKEKDFINIFKSHLKDETQVFIKDAEGSHYGVGQIHVNLFAISKLENQVKVTETLNDILNAIRKFV